MDMKKIVWIMLSGIVFSLGFFVIQHITISRKINQQQVLYENLKEKESHIVKVLEQIVYSNLNPVRIQDEDILSYRELYMCVDFPVCNSCFTKVSHVLYEYCKTEGKALIVICRAKYVNQIEKVLKFEGINTIEVKAMEDADKMQSKFTIIFKPKKGNGFYLPLPENHEVEFLKTFLK